MLILAAAYLGRERVRINVARATNHVLLKSETWSFPEGKKLLAICSGIEIAKQVDNCVTSASVSSAAHRKCSFTTSLDRYWITYKTLV